MTVTTPAPEPAPAHEGFLGHLRDFFEKDVAPRLVSLEADLAKAKALAPEVQTLAGIVEKIAEAADPSAAPEIAALAAGAGKVAARIGEIVASLEASGV